MGWCYERLSIQAKKKRFIFIYYFHFLSYGNLLWLYFLNIDVNFFFIDIVLPLIILVCTFRFYCLLIPVFAEMPRWKSAISKITVLNKISRRSKQNCGFSEKQSTECQTNLWLSMTCLYGYRPTLQKQHLYQF